MLGPNYIHRFARTAMRLRYQSLWGLCLCLVSFSACKLDEKPPPAGGLVVAVDTDMGTPKDIDQVRLEVLQGATMLLQHDQALASGAATLPLEFQVPQVADSTPVLIRAIGLKDATPRVERSAITMVPASYLGYVKLTLNYLCDGMVGPNGESSCGATETCVQGSCQPAAIATELPDFYKREGANGELTSGSTACFNVEKCFSNATMVTPDPTKGCSFEASKLFATDLNVGIKLEPGSAGICTRTRCWIVLDSDANGFRIGDGQRVFLPQSVCDQLEAGAELPVAVSMQCQSKTPNQPLCRESMMPATGDPNDPITVGTIMGSPVGDACAGGGQRACEMCGSQMRSCQSGLWSEFSMCADQGVCIPEVVETCGTEGIRTCNGDCTWGDCESQTCDGPATRSCGNCGTQHRNCNNGVWSEWSPCGEEGVCMPGATQTCGVGGTQACEGSCEWGECSMQACEGAATGACGNCGSRSRTCDANTAVWSDWGVCEDEGECSPDSTMPCGRDGTQTCGGNCRWDVACTGQTCEGPARRACGLCGTQTRTCDMNSGEYSDWSACFGEGECDPDTRTSCGRSGERTCGGNCRWGSACTGQVCEGSATRACGNCGIQSRSCNTNSGEWTGWGECRNEGDCSPGDTMACGAGGTKTCLNSCRWDTACPGQECTGPTSRPCVRGGNNQYDNPCGEQVRTCNTSTGTFNAWGACSMARNGCTPNADEACGGNNNLQRHHLCGARGSENQCDWGACICRPGFNECTPGGACVDFKTDENHCDGCNKKCAPEQTCNDGTCQCPAGQELCTANGMSKCVNVHATDSSNCGACGMVCQDGSACMGGQCLCPTTGGTPQTYCKSGTSGQCVNTVNDANNCGRCGHDCIGGQICSGSMCQCPPNRTWCEAVSTCVDLQTDEQHCGACTGAGSTCATGQVCMGGTCVEDCSSEPGTTLCGNKCADLKTDEQNCGMCRKVCNGDQCLNSDCGCPNGTAQCGGPGTPCVALNTTTHCGSCMPCGSRPNADLTGCSAQGQCQYDCKFVECRGACCANGQVCGTNGCETPLPTCNPMQHLCGTMCVMRSAESCTAACTECPGRAGGVPICTANDQCDIRCNFMECGNVCCAEGQVCGANGACTNPTPTCAADEHLCGTMCVKRSAQSCTAACTQCPTRTGGDPICTANDQCDIDCDFMECNNVCCAEGQVCGANGACTNPTPTCAADEHLCGTMCVKRSAQSCTAACTQCPTRTGGDPICTANDQCDIDCDFMECNNVCCAQGQVCGANGTCTTPVPTCQADEHLCGTTCVKRSAQSCTAACTQCPTRTGGVPICTANDQCDIDCNFTECNNVCCAQGQECGTNGACTTPVPTCTGNEHLCGNDCVPRSATSCTPACISCPDPGPNGSATCTNDQCGIACEFMRCNNTCCGEGQMCLQGTCRDPAPPTPTGGSGGSIP